MSTVTLAVDVQMEELARVHMSAKEKHDEICRVARQLLAKIREALAEVAEEEGLGYEELALAAAAAMRAALYAQGSGRGDAPVPTRDVKRLLEELGRARSVVATVDAAWYVSVRLYDCFASRRDQGTSYV